MRQAQQRTMQGYSVCLDELGAPCTCDACLLCTGNNICTVVSHFMALERSLCLLCRA